MKSAFLKRFIRTSIILGLILSLGFQNLPVFAAGPPGSPEFAADHVLVKFRPGVAAAAQMQVYSRQEGSVIGGINKLGIVSVKVPPGKLQEKLRGYRSESSVEFAEPDYKVKVFGTPDDPFFPNQWGMTKIQLPQAWDVTTGNSTVIIAILDTGVDQDHEDLAAKIVASINFSASNTTDDLYGHGSHVAGIAAAVTNNARGVAGAGFARRTHRICNALQQQNRAERPRLARPFLLMPSGRAASLGRCSLRGA